MEKTVGENREVPLNQQSLDINRRKVSRALGYTILFDIVIALLLTVLNYGGDFIENLIFSQCIGITICSCILTGFYFFKPERGYRKLALLAITLIIGAVVGTLLGTLVSGTKITWLTREYWFFIQVVFISVVFGAVISNFLLSREKLSTSETMMQEERIRRISSEKQALAANLKLLQAQIEPHFLFNTLSNILSLMDTDLPKAKSMQTDLIQYLRTSLSRTRGEETTVGQEMEMITAYLNIFKIRMGDRLRYSIQVPVGIRNHAFAPMLMQPLVENAVKHGLEPKIEGGQVTIKGQVEGDVLALSVTDTGMGMTAGSKTGIGLENTKDRLMAMYGKKGRLILEENRPTGLKAIIEVPYVKPEGDYCR
jgi:sensor histidine kinase YesM